MRVAVPRETAPGERRVALVPEAVGELAAAGFSISSSAGPAPRRFPDEDYAEAGADVGLGRALAGAEVVVRVGRPATG